mmetsp:Transcript_31740/g.48661  ORF Transcript_31740/g.48661 Transcript_31740/m.48661 type:complete len:108 (-) Transcript_31740:2534-2857(-)
MRCAQRFFDKVITPLQQAYSDNSADWQEEANYSFLSDVHSGFAGYLKLSGAQEKLRGPSSQNSIANLEDDFSISEYQQNLERVFRQSGGNSMARLTMKESSFYPPMN